MADLPPTVEKIQDKGLLDLDVYTIRQIISGLPPEEMVQLRFPPFREAVLQHARLHGDRWLLSASVKYPWPALLKCCLHSPKLDVEWLRIHGLDLGEHLKFPFNVPWLRVQDWFGGSVHFECPQEIESNDSFWECGRWINRSTRRRLAHDPNFVEVIRLLLADSRILGVPTQRYEVDDYTYEIWGTVDFVVWMRQVPALTLILSDPRSSVGQSTLATAIRMGNPHIIRLIMDWKIRHGEMRWNYDDLSLLNSSDRRLVQDDFEVSRCLEFHRRNRMGTWAQLVLWSG